MKTEILKCGEYYTVRASALHELAKQIGPIEDELGELSQRIDELNGSDHQLSILLNDSFVSVRTKSGKSMKSQRKNSERALLEKP